MADTRIASVNVGLLADVGNFIQNIGAAEAKARSSFGAMQKTIVGFGEAVGISLGTAAVLGAVKYIDDIGTALKRMSVTVNDSSKDLKELQMIAVNVWKGTDADIKKATESVVALTNKTNLTGKALQAAAIQAQQLASITGGDPTQLIKSSSVLANAYGRSTDDIVSINERLFKTTRATGIEFQALVQAATEAQPIFSKLGLSLEDTEAFLGMLSKNGIDAETAITSFRHAIEKMQSEGVENLHKGFNDLIYAMRTGAITAKEINEFFGKTGPMVTKIFTDARFNIEDTKKAIDAITQTIGSTEAGGESLGTQFNKLIKNLGDDALTIIDSLQSTLVTLAPLIEIIANQLSNLSAVVAAAIKSIAETITNPFRAIQYMANSALQPYRELIDSQAAGATALIFGDKAYNNFRQSKTPYNDSNNNRVEPLGHIPVSYIIDVNAAAEANAKWKKSLEDIFGKLPTMADNLRTFAKTMRDSMTSSFMDIVNGSKTVAQAFASMANSIIQSIEKMIFEQAVSTPITGAITNLIGNALHVNLAQSGVMGSIGSAPSGYDWTTAPVNFSVPPISGAKAVGGTVWSGQSYMVGENGPERFTPATNGTISPNGAGGIVINHNINVTAGVPEAVAIAVKQAVASSSKQAAFSVADAVRRGGRNSRNIKGY